MASPYRPLRTSPWVLAASLALSALTIQAAVKPTGKDCVACHAPARKQAEKKFVHAPFKDEKGCESCHKRHGVVGALVLKEEEPGLCFSCHKKEEPSFKLAHVHAPLKPAKDAKAAACSACHLPHASDFKGLLRKSGNEACLSCHKRESFTGKLVHKPAAESCLSCHSPHASAEAALLSKPVKELCASCHRAGGPAKPGTHTGFAVDKLACTACHSPHAAGEKGLLRAVVHAPLSDCSTCHAPPAAGQKLTKPDPALCFDCHSDRQADLKKPVVHEAFKGTCTACHTPHATDQKALLVSSQKDLCGSCHDMSKELAPGSEKAPRSVHKPAAEGDCAKCHDPHASASKKLLKAEGAALCATCHEKAKTWGAKKNVHTPFAGGGCLSCHVAHGGEFPRLAAKPGAESCYACHEDQKKAFGKTFAHAPVREGQCAKCHDPHASDLPKYLLKPADKLCVSCHEQTIARAPGEDGKSGTPHPPFASGECATCHDPHATSRTRLLKDVASKLCEGCHSDVIDKAEKAGKGGSLHQPVKAGTCESCHDAHGSRQPAYLTGAPRTLCLKCHGALEARLKKAKAVVHKPVADGKCLDCHGGHSSASPALLSKPVPAVCASCHDLKAPGLVKKHGGFSLEKTNCSSCHDPHVSQKKGLFNPVFHPPFTDGDCASCHRAPAAGAAPAAPSASLNAKGADLCTPCHGDFPERFKRAWTHAPAKQGDCVSCHSPHASKEKKLVSGPLLVLCTGCHESIAKDLAMKSVHPPVKDGLCAKCHDAHASDLKKGLVKAGGDLCFSCHAPEKALLKAKTVHAPFGKGDCGRCHDPHASNSAAQLRAPAGELCRKCHDLAAPKTAQAHKSFPMAGADCLSCHNPHASDQQGLVRNKPHAVLNTCARCHNVAGGKPRDLVAKTTDLCFRCHGAVKVAAAKPGAHKAFQQGCVACHTPHAADARGLPKGNERENCLSCHSQKKQQAAQARSLHPLKVENGRCSICHTGHVSEFGSLLKTAPADLCKDCHKSHSDFAHPFGPGVIDPRTGKTLTCLSCHDPHGTAYPATLTDNPQRALCVQCHKSEGPSLGTGHGGTTKRGAPSGRPSP